MLQPIDILMSSFHYGYFTMFALLEKMCAIRHLEQVSELELVQEMGRVGTQVPLYSCAPGKAILGGLAETKLDEWLATIALKSFTENTKASRKELLS